MASHRAAQRQGEEHDDGCLQVSCKLVRQSGVEQVERHGRHDDDGVNVTRIFLQTNFPSKWCNEVMLKPETFQEDEGSG